jgi:hypothetical protein
MKKALILILSVFAAAALIVWVASWFWNSEAVTKASAQPWPGGLGDIDSLAKRYPPHPPNKAAMKLTELARAVPENDAVTAYVRGEIMRDEMMIGAPPAIADLSAIRELLLREPIVWDLNIGMSEDGAVMARGAQMTMARALVASALGKARANDPAAWEDLRAVWILARALDDHPHMMMKTAQLSMERFINGVAWKMPLPAPAWLSELQARDGVRPVLEGFQHQTAGYAKSYSRVFPTKPLADAVDRHRAIAERIWRTTQCEVHAPVNEWGPDLSSVWQRALRYRAEREATANALRIRRGESIETKSVCSGGTWSYDGTTLRFSQALPSTDPRDAPMPLTLHVSTSR